ncbi:MAG: helix-turn-helix domain-containing protein, partial [Desulfobacterales bacterium]|nr:helix-turn-helix domain-containing protein [Desulfobacterales bacterium]
MKLNINEIARCLDLPVSTLDRWIRQGRIPVQKSGPNWSFDAQVLKKWAAAR